MVVLSVPSTECRRLVNEVIEDRAGMSCLQPPSRIGFVHRLTGSHHVPIPIMSRSPSCPNPHHVPIPTPTLILPLALLHAYSLPNFPAPLLLPQMSSLPPVAFSVYSRHAEARCHPLRELLGQTRHLPPVKETPRGHVGVMLYRTHDTGAV